MKILKYCIGLLLCPMVHIYAQQATKHHMRMGKVLAADNKAGLASAVLQLSSNSKNFLSDDNGNFSLPILSSPDTLIIGYVGFITQKVALQVNDSSNILVLLEADTKAPNNVIVSTGYQTLSKERATGSFDFINKDLINRSVSTNILNRIESVTPGILFNHGDAGNTEPLLIRGRSSIFAEVSPLIILDNFPYDGNINNINPNDIENIVVLKDAAAASIWGARAGNGVIVITTRKGNFGKPIIELNSSVNITGKPDLYSLRALPGSDYIDLEKDLFTQGYYDATLSDPGHLAVSPVVDLLAAQKNGLITEAAATAQIQALKKYDVRRDLTQSFYQTAINRQHSLSINGGNTGDSYFLSAGWDDNSAAGNLRGNLYDRVTIHAQNTLSITNNLRADASINFVQSNTTSGNNPGYSMPGLYPYTSLVGTAGNGLALDNIYRKGFTDTLTAASMPGWKYTPLDDINYTKNTNKTADYLVSTSLRYRLNAWLDAEARYQYEYAVNTVKSVYSDSSFYVRNLVNSYYQPGVSNTTPVPFGSIVDNSSTETVSHQGRFQVNYHQVFNTKHRLTAIAGWEIKSVTTSTTRYRLYGYLEQGSLTNTQMDFNTYYQLYNNPYQSAQIPNPQYIDKTVDRFISYYANAAYSFDNRYTLSASGRNDAANLFGVKTNQKGVPLWSAGFAWNVSNENFYHLSILPYLKLRLTYGYNGNYSRLASALTTVAFSTSSTTPLTTASIQNPPNADLRWEVVRMFNAGLDFESKNKRLAGTIEFYNKNAVDLIAPVSLDPTLGFAGSVYQNTASMKGKGLDVQLESRNTEGLFNWLTTFIFSYATSKVTNYIAPVSSNASIYLNNQVINPVIGKPLYSIFSYRWGGLDPQTGAPMGYIGKGLSSDIPTIISSTKLDSLIYNGPAQPTYYGALRNTFSWRGFTFSFNISYKLGYYFRKPSVNYTNLEAAWYWSGSADYVKRWQKPGDEQHTSVPALINPVNGLSDNFYSSSDVLVEKADNIRLEDIRLDYTFDKTKFRNLPLNKIVLYIYASNLGKLWVANKDRIDPYYNNSPINGKSIAFGLKANF